MQYMFYVHADAMIMSCDDNELLEAMGMDEAGKSVIAALRSELQVYMQDGVTSLLCDPDAAPMIVRSDPYYSREAVAAGCSSTPNVVEESSDTLSTALVACVQMLFDLWKIGHAVEKSDAGPTPSLTKRAKPISGKKKQDQQLVQEPLSDMPCRGQAVLHNVAVYCGTQAMVDAYSKKLEVQRVQEEEAISEAAAKVVDEGFEDCTPRDDIVYDKPQLRTSNSFTPNTEDAETPYELFVMYHDIAQQNMLDLGTANQLSATELKARKVLGRPPQSGRKFYSAQVIEGIAGKLATGGVDVPKLWEAVYDERMAEMEVQNEGDIPPPIKRPKRKEEAVVIGYKRLEFHTEDVEEMAELVKKLNALGLVLNEFLSSEELARNKEKAASSSGCMLPGQDTAVGIMPTTLGDTMLGGLMEL
ncbi:hypothetical protein CEUSTIGMA_g13923.t1 [Chlamydomonas eustigma]|uniref:Uncharacterized protein n=1 Tax=Chlamydomonas eustigma TaxID=1157962 RepID=A0A250XU06_9CHLO|nr:hypothetical protein CEUSTIGMA_g13923.t1 [Chlamydomonas eustigma]|eukprot:GAX86516.1 hypothetical protein CEUSTIGMA_g13923.t1 [Chlamydomonas eustigma]